MPVRWTRACKRLLNEPLLHFAVLGGALFTLVQFAADETYPNSSAPQALTVTAHQQAQLRTQWLDQTGRLPNPKEFAALIKQYVDDEILVREAIRLGLHRSDDVVRDRLVKNLQFADGHSYTQPSTLQAYQRLLESAYSLGMQEHDLVVRRRLVQRMQHIIHSQVTVAEKELKAWYDSHQAHFKTPKYFRVEQLFFNHDTRASPKRNALAAKRQLGEGTPPASINSDALLLNGKLSWITQPELRNSFGDDFAEAVLTASEGRWSAPINSAYGVHVLRVTHTGGGQLAPFAQARAQVVAAVYAARERDALQAALAQFRQRYRITIDTAALSELSGAPDPAS